MKVLHDHDAPIVLGPDAHEPNDLGRNLEEAVRLVKKVGYLEACRFSCRERARQDLTIKMRVKQEVFAKEMRSLDGKLILEDTGLPT